MKMNRFSVSEATVPRFENEADEAEWWYANRERIERDMAAALEQGNRAVRYNVSPGPIDKKVTLDAVDAALALELAAKSGETYEAFVRRVVHEALQLQKAV